MEAVLTNHDKITLKFRRRSQNFEGGVKFWKEVKNPMVKHRKKFANFGRRCENLEGGAKFWKQNYCFLYIFQGDTRDRGVWGGQAEERER